MAEAPIAIDLFCGAGGLSTGLEWAGFDVVWAVDSDSDVEATYEANHTAPVTIADIGDLTASEMPITMDDIDLVAGGPPCPTFSKIGRSKIGSLDRQTPANDARHYLFEDFLRFVNTIQPEVFLMENVADFQSTAGIERESIIEEIKRQSADAGYQTTVYELDAADFGVPQHRERCFIIGNQLDEPNPDLEARATHRAPVRDTETKLNIRRQPDAFTQSAQATMNKYLPEETTVGAPGDRKPWVTVGDAILDLPPVSPDGTTPPKTADSYRLPPITPYQEWARNRDNVEDWTTVQLANHTCRGHNMLDLSIYKLLGEGAGWDISDISQDLHPYRDDVFTDKYKKQHPRKPASTIIAHLEKDGHMFIHPREARSLTVREAARLQSFPDTFKFKASMVNNFRLVGNAVPPKLAESLGEAIRDILLAS
ncbi:DNA cytosine methyltransferase [Halorubrum sp. AS12]|uniref:DNA cytosine methyltransferase n=1 Tax=Halorubrum sp. AS12 TaxID=3409687 RepID=UPI003DA756FD